MCTLNSQWELQMRLQMIPIESSSSSTKYIIDKTNNGYFFGNILYPNTNTHDVFLLRMENTFLPSNINHLFSQTDLNDKHFFFLMFCCMIKQKMLKSIINNKNVNDPKSLHFIWKCFGFLRRKRFFLSSDVIFNYDL